jgi:hypothetical protein
MFLFLLGEHGPETSREHTQANARTKLLLIINSPIVLTSRHFGPQAQSALPTPAANDRPVVLKVTFIGLSNAEFARCGAAP